MLSRRWGDLPGGPTEHPQPNAVPAADALQPPLRCGFRARMRRGVRHPDLQWAQTTAGRESTCP
jgi:hypothetical protein